jgi:hypothetical protein
MSNISKKCVKRKYKGELKVGRANYDPTKIGFGAK